VGTCSYLLISFWHTRESAATAGKKAFVTNRVGDWGFMLAMFLAFSAVGTLSFTELNEFAESGELVASTATGIAALVFLGAVGKSAQLPLYFWLPDAMEGPTPVSALIHAATMVTAGVFVMTRINPITEAGYDWVPTMVAWIGGITALFAATIAVAQNDVKRVLAYSTVSQLGYMFLAVGTGAYVAAIFHMVTHAFFKALLFLGSGSVIHGMHDEQDMRKMGLLFKLMPITAVTFIIGWLAIAGVPPFAGFWSKDEILLFALADNTALYVIGLGTAVLTAYYMTRQVVMVFFGEARWKSHAEEHGAHGEFKPHESPAVMLLPLVVLAGLSIVGGGIQLPFSDSVKRLEHWLHPVVEVGEAEITETWAYDNKYLLLAFAVVGAVIGIIGAWMVYQRKRAKAVEPEILAQGWYYDAAVSDFMGGPGRKVFDGIAWVDEKVVDGAVNGSATLVKTASRGLRRGENGFVRAYAGILSVGVVLALVWFVVVRGML
jgi:NADH-quinone oxidoreductase subunit L